MLKYTSNTEFNFNPFITFREKKKVHVTESWPPYYTHILCSLRKNAQWKRVVYETKLCYQARSLKLIQ